MYRKNRRGQVNTFSQKKKGQVNTYSSHKLIYMINKMEEPRRDNHYYDKTLNKMNVKFHSLPTT